jgi:hypothetical protein
VVQHTLAVELTACVVLLSLKQCRDREQMQTGSSTREAPAGRCTGHKQHDTLEQTAQTTENNSSLCSAVELQHRGSCVEGCMHACLQGLKTRFE